MYGCSQHTHTHKQPCAKARINKYERVSFVGFSLLSIRKKSVNVRTKSKSTNDHNKGAKMECRSITQIVQLGDLWDLRFVWWQQTATFCIWWPRSKLDCISEKDAAPETSGIRQYIPYARNQGELHKKTQSFQTPKEGRVHFPRIGHNHSSSRAANHVLGPHRETNNPARIRVRRLRTAATHLNSSCPSMTWP